MATCWQLLSLCLESAGCSLSNQRLGGSGGRKEVRVRQTVNGGGGGVSWYWRDWSEEEDEEEADGLLGGGAVVAVVLSCQGGAGTGSRHPQNQSAAGLGKAQHQGLDQSL